MIWHGILCLVLSILPTARAISFEPDGNQINTLADCQEAILPKLKHVTLRTVTVAAPDLSIVLQSILSIQKSLIVDRNIEDISKGFLISQFELPELLRLMHDGSYLILAQTDTVLLGYALITPINEFTDLLKQAGTTLEMLKPVDFHRCLYLYQVAVDPSARQLGIGHRLINEAKRTAHGFLLADILTKPIENKFSIDFFHKHSFDPVGYLNLKSYRNFGNLQSMVVLWK